MFFAMESVALSLHRFHYKCMSADLSSHKATVTHLAGVGECSSNTAVPEVRRKRNQEKLLLCEQHGCVQVADPKDGGSSGHSEPGYWVAQHTL